MFLEFFGLQLGDLLRQFRLKKNALQLGEVGAGGDGRGSRI